MPLTNVLKRPTLSLDVLWLFSSFFFFNFFCQKYTLLLPLLWCVLYHSLKSINIYTYLILTHGLEKQSKTQSSISEESQVQWPKFSGPKKKGRKEEERKIAKLIVAKEDAKKGQFSTQQSKQYRSCQTNSFSSKSKRGIKNSVASCIYSLPFFFTLQFSFSLLFCLFFSLLLFAYWTRVVGREDLAQKSSKSGKCHIATFASFETNPLLHSLHFVHSLLTNDINLNMLSILSFGFQLATLLFHSF